MPAMVLIAVMMTCPVVQTRHFSVSRVQLPTFKATFAGFARQLLDWPPPSRIRLTVAVVGENF